MDKAKLLAKDLRKWHTFSRSTVVGCQRLCWTLASLLRWLIALEMYVHVNLVQLYSNSDVRGNWNWLLPDPQGNQVIPATNLAWAVSDSALAMPEQEYCSFLQPGQPNDYTGSGMDAQLENVAVLGMDGMSDVLSVYDELSVYPPPPLSPPSLPFGTGYALCMWSAPHDITKPICS